MTESATEVYERASDVENPEKSSTEGGKGAIKFEEGAIEVVESATEV